MKPRVIAAPCAGPPFLLSSSRAAVRRASRILPATSEFRHSESVTGFPSPAQPSIMNYGNHSSGLRKPREDRTFDPRRNEFRATYEGRRHRAELRASLDLCAPWILRAQTRCAQTPPQIASRIPATRRQFCPPTSPAPAPPLIVDDRRQVRPPLLQEVHKNSPRRRPRNHPQSLGLLPQGARRPEASLR